VVIPNPLQGNSSSYRHFIVSRSRGGLVRPELRDESQGRF
jgi:hypothetical protein